MKQTLTEAQLLKHLRRQEFRLVNASLETQRQLAKLYKDYFARLETLMRRNLTRSNLYHIRDAVEIMNQLTTTLDDAGLQSVMTGYRARLVEIGEASNIYLEAFGIDSPSLAGIDAKTLDALIDYNANELRALVTDELTKPVSNMLIQSLTGSRTRSEVVDEISQAIDDGRILRRDGKEFTSNNVNVMVNQSTREFDSHVKEEKAAALGLDYRIYRGPEDTRTRDACRYLLTSSPHGEGVWKTSDLAGLAQKFPDHSTLEGNVLVRRGGYNCRHWWAAIDERRAKLLGVSAQGSA